MTRRRRRDLALVIAIWAVVFAPGSFDVAAADDIRSGEVADELAAAVIAPTTGDGAVVASRPSRDRTDHDATSLGPATAVALPDSAPRSPDPLAGRSGPRPSERAGSSAAPRGPPLV